MSKKKKKNKKRYSYTDNIARSNIYIYRIYGDNTKKKRTRKDKRTCLFYNKKSGKCKNNKCHTTYCTTAAGCTLYKRKKKSKKKVITTAQNKDNKLRYQDEFLDYPNQPGIHEYTPILDKGLTKNIGTSCHTTFIKKKDGRRDKRRCIHYLKNNKYCGYYGRICGGSTRCDKYKEKP